VCETAEPRLKSILRISKSLFFHAGWSNSAAPTKERQDGPGCRYSSAAAITVMQAAYHRFGKDSASLRRFYRT
jgi:hypothetical protein